MYTRLTLFQFDRLAVCLHLSYLYRRQIDLHDFAAMGKHCEGLEEADPDSDGAIDETLPVEEEQPLAPVLMIKKTRYATPYAFCRGKLKPSSSSKTRHAKRWPTSKQSKIRLRALPQHPSRPLAPKTTTPIPPSRRNQDLHLAHLVSGTVLAAVKTCAYIDFINVLPRLIVKPETRGDVIIGTSDRKLKTSATNKSSIESFDSWLVA